MSAPDAVVNFSVHEAALKTAARALVESHLGAAPYEHTRVRAAVRTLSDAILAAARSAAGDKWKICVDVAVLQTGAGFGGMATHSAVLWDPSTDAAITLSVPSADFVTVVSIFGLSL